MEALIAALSILGFIILCRTLVTFCGWVWVTFLRRPKDLKQYGSWAVITGSTDGIGKALALELASKGLNLVLVGRDPVKLALTSDDVRNRHGGEVEIKNIVIDFAKHNGEEIAGRIEEGIAGLDVGILINNAGMADYCARFFHELDLKTMESIMKVNVDGATWVTKAVLPGMLKKKKGAIVNMGSASTFFVPSFPLNSIYAGTKAYISMFSRCISLEYKQRGIDIQCQIPSLVATKMVRMKKANFFAPSAEMYSKASIRRIGYEHLCSPYWQHSIQWSLSSLVPDAVLNWFVLHFFLRLREAGQRKKSMGEKKNNP